MRLKTKKYAPSEKLLNFIDCYWVIENKAQSTIELPIIPDGCMDIIFHNNQLVLSGAMDEGIIVDFEPNDSSFGIRFKPAILSHLLKQSSDTFINKIIPLKNVSEELFELLNFTEEDETLKVLHLNTIFETLFTSIQLNQHIVPIVNKIIKSKGSISLSEALQDADITQRQLQRLSLYYIGFSAKKFSNITRFFYIFKEFIKTGTTNLTAKAYNFGYCDQAHLNKEFKKFSNFSPKNKTLSIFYS